MVVLPSCLRKEQSTQDSFKLLVTFFSNGLNLKTDVEKEKQSPVSV